MRLDLKATAEKIQGFFDEKVDEIARQTEFVRRESDLTGLVFLKAMVFGSIEKPAATLLQWAQACCDLGVEITPQGIDGRINRHSVAFLKAMFSQALDKFKSDLPLPLPILHQFTAINILDSSVMALPDTMVDAYPGCGGDASQASLKVQLVMDFLLGNLKQVVLQAGRESDQGFRAYLDVVEAGSLNLFDLGYFCLTAFRAISDKQAYFLSRYLYPTSVLTPEGQPMDLVRRLQAETMPWLDEPVLLGTRCHLPCRLIAIRLPQPVADRRRQKTIDHARRRGTTLSQPYLALMDWAIFVTTVPAERLSAQQVARLYRVRWQIELIFKMWKSYSGLKHIPGLRAERVLTELYAKMIGVVLTHFLLAPLRMPAGTWANREISPVQMRTILARFARELSRGVACLDQVVNVLTNMLEHILRFGFKQKRRKKPNVCHLLALASLPFDLDADCELLTAFQLC